MTSNQPARVRLDAAAAARAAVEAQLDAALANTFPASDPVAITVRKSGMRAAAPLPWRGTAAPRETPGDGAAPVG